MVTSLSMRRARLIGWGLALGAALLSTGCDRPAADRPDAAAAAPRPVWQKGKLVLEGAVGDMTYDLSDGDSKNAPLVIEAYFSGFPAGSELSIGSSSATATASGEYRAKESVRDRVGQLTVDEALGDAADLKLTVGIAMPGRAPLETPLPPLDLRASLARAFGELPEQGWRFPGEPDYAGEPRSVAVVGPPSAQRTLRVLGPAKRLWEVDWVAIEQRHETPEVKRCGGYHRRIDVQLKMYGSKVTVRDRRVGNVLQEKDFAASDRCPQNPLLKPDGSTIAYVPPADVDRWLSQELGLKTTK